MCEITGSNFLPTTLFPEAIGLPAVALAKSCAFASTAERGAFCSHAALVLLLLLVVDECESAAPVVVGPITDTTVKVSCGSYYTFKTQSAYFSINCLGTLGNGNSHPGLIFDPAASGVFNDATDFITPGSPREAFHMTGFNTSVQFAHTNNNAGVANVAFTSFTDQSMYSLAVRRQEIS